MDLLFVVFLAVIFIQLLFYVFIFSRLAFFSTNNGISKPSLPISVIICVKNEEINLSTNLPLVLRQEYPNYEVIIVNDGSNDNTGKVLEGYISKYQHLKVITLSEEEGSFKGKKYALTQGIKAATNEYILLTDADCQPSGSNWIRLMAANFDRGKAIVLGYSPYKKKKGILNKWIRFETVYTGLQYLSFSLIGIPYMGVGRNMAYKKDLFFQVKGFDSHKHIMSGDDDLFINEIANAKNCTIELNKESFTYHEPKKSFTYWLRQKRRHLTTGTHYKLYHQIVLGVLVFSHILTYLLFLILLINLWETFTIITLFIIRTFVQTIIFSKVLRKLDEIDLLLLVPFFDFLYLAFYIILAPSAILSKNRRWE